MNPPLKLAVIIPAYNEEACIEAVLDAVNHLRPQGIEVVPVVINDCSKDTTGELISRLNCVALHLPINLGIGGAVQTGIKYAFNNGFDFAVQIDADGQHPPHHIPLLLQQLRQHQWDVVIGSRFIEKQGFQSTFLRRAGIRFLEWVLRLVTGCRVTDPTSGMRLMNRKAMKALYDSYPDEYPEPEAIVLFARAGLRFGEVPVQMSNRLGGESSIRGLQGPYYIFKVTIAIVFTYLRK